MSRKQSPMRRPSMDKGRTPEAVTRAGDQAGRANDTHRIVNQIIEEFRDRHPKKAKTIRRR